MKGAQRIAGADDAFLLLARLAKYAGEQLPASHTLATVSGIPDRTVRSMVVKAKARVEKEGYIVHRGEELNEQAISSEETSPNPEANLTKNTLMKKIGSLIDEYVDNDSKGKLDQQVSVATKRLKKFVKQSNENEDSPTTSPANVAAKGKKPVKQSIKNEDSLDASPAKTAATGLKFPVKQSVEKETSWTTGPTKTSIPGLKIPVKQSVEKESPLTAVPAKTATKRLKETVEQSIENEDSLDESPPRKKKAVPPRKKEAVASKLAKYREPSPSTSYTSHNGDSSEDGGTVRLIRTSRPRRRAMDPETLNLIHVNKQLTKGINYRLRTSSPEDEADSEAEEVQEEKPKKKVSKTSTKHK